jgi:3-deoxy-manno-octulosonate cytidylyltransferase (CMP-KDO synthetase)
MHKLLHKVPRRVGVIPARALSSRFPLKVLAPISGKPLVQRVWEAAIQSRLLHRVVVATDDERVRQAVHGFGGEAIMTPPSLPSGTDRVFYAIQGWDADVVVNLQGDEPLLEGAAIDALIEGLEIDENHGMATLAIPRESRQEQGSPHVVKVRFREGGHVEDFSREAFDTGTASFFKHLGIYAFRRHTLETFCSLPPSARETRERLEQLRALENGIAIKAVVWPTDTVAVDTPEDVARVEAVLAEREKGKRSE